MNNVLHSSSFLEKACNPLHVLPSLIRCGTCSISMNCMSRSSGSNANSPHADFRLTFEVSAFPEGLTPRGCRRTRVSSPYWPLTDVVLVFRFLLGGSSASDCSTRALDDVWRVITNYSKYRSRKGSDTRNPDLTPMTHELCRCHSRCLIFALRVCVCERKAKREVAEWSVRWPSKNSRRFKEIQAALFAPPQQHHCTHSPISTHSPLEPHDSRYREPGI